MFDINRMQCYIEQNFDVVNAEYIVSNILHYVAMQDWGKEESLDVLLGLLDGTDLEREELAQFF